MPTAIHCRDLRKTYDGKVEAVRGLDLTSRPGECFGLLGPNGAGKTTTIEILEGLLDAHLGRSRDSGQDLADATSANCGRCWASRCRRPGSRKS